MKRMGGTREESAVYLTPLYYAEIGVTKRLRRLQSHPTSRLVKLRGREIRFDHLVLRSGVTLAPSQEEAVRQALANKVTILTGGPGTGKTTTLRTLLDLLDTPAAPMRSPRRRGGRRSGWPKRPAGRPRPSTACWSSSRAKDLAATTTTRSTPT